MKTEELYKKLEKDFITRKMHDEWAEHMSSVREFLSRNFIKRSMGLVCDFADDVEKVYTAVFPSERVMKYVLKSKNAMLFVHHPSIWDIRKTNVFQQMEKVLLKQFRERKISIYNLHVPLDNYGEYSTGFTLAKAVGITPKKAFAPYRGGLCGAAGKAEAKTLEELKKDFERAVGHKVKVYNYGDNEIRKSGAVGGGGCSVDILEECVKLGIDTLVTGVTAKNSHSMKAHEFAEKNRINILGGTHYSTEKFACIELTKYFRKLGIPSEFVEDIPVMEDM